MVETDVVSIGANGVISIDAPVSSFDEVRLKGLVQRLFDLSEKCSYAAFRGTGTGETGVILLCGFNERFRTLRLLERIDVDCLVVQDTVAPWFTGSATCEGLDHVSAVARSTFPRVKRWVLVGQSSGGYGALALSRMMDHSLALALAPQTFDDHVFKDNNVFFPRNFHASRTISGNALLRDLRDIFFDTPAINSKAYIVAAFSEHQNPPTEWLWMDAMHWGRLVDHPDVRVFVTTGSSHPVLLGGIHLYSGLLRQIVDHPTWADPAIVATIRRIVHPPLQAPPGPGPAASTAGTA